MTAGLHLAFSFLTRLPVPTREKYGEEDFKNSFIYFPVVGLAIGFMAALISAALIYAGAREFITAFLILAFIIAVTGGLHIDGLADTADGFMGGTDGRESLRIMKDSHVGSFGVAAVALVLVGKFAALWTCLETGLSLSIVVPFVLSRWVMTAVSVNARYPRRTGTGKHFVGKITMPGFALSTVLALVITVSLAGYYGILLLVVAAGVAYGFRRLSDKKIEGVTGDVLGAANEVAELVLLSLI